MALPPPTSCTGRVALYLPVAFVSSLIKSLYLIYITCHVVPLLQWTALPMVVDLDARRRGKMHALVVTGLVAVLLYCYGKAISVHPGRIPDNQAWQMEAAPQQLEVKQTGERRFCKWCSLYKPDRCHHCRVCRSCVLRMDHHCPWIANCVGFHNYKYFFLLTLYTVLCAHFIVWTMWSSAIAAVDRETPFAMMFALLFGQTIGSFITVLGTLFLGFHCKLITEGMTLIEFCEKATKHRENGLKYHNAYDLGTYRNICSSLGPNPALWLVPVGLPKGDGLSFAVKAGARGLRA